MSNQIILNLSWWPDTQWEHTHVNSLGWTSAQGVNAQPCIPCSVSHVLPRVSCPSLAVLPWLWGSSAPFQGHWPQPPMSLLALCHGLGFKTCPSLSGEKTQKVPRNPKGKDVSYWTHKSSVRQLPYSEIWGLMQSSPPCPNPLRGWSQISSPFPRTSLVLSTSMV